MPNYKQKLIKLCSLYSTLSLPLPFIFQHAQYFLCLEGTMCTCFTSAKNDSIHCFLLSVTTLAPVLLSSAPCFTISVCICVGRGEHRVEQTDVVEIKKNSWIASSSLLSVLIEARLVLSWELAAPADNITAAPSNKQRQKGFDWFTVPETKFTYTHHKRLLCLSSYNLVAVRSAIKLIFHQYGATKLV